MPLLLLHLLKSNHSDFAGHRKDLLTMLDWMQLVEQKMKAKDFLSIEKAYGDIIYHQYNLHLLEHEKLQGKVRYFHWPDAPSK